MDKDETTAGQGLKDESLLGALETLNKKIRDIKNILNIGIPPSDNKEPTAILDKVSYCASMTRTMKSDVEEILTVIRKL